MSQNTVYNIFYEDEEWKAKKRGAKRASATGSRRPQVVQEARRFAKNNKPSQVRVLNKRGDLVTRDDFGSSEPQDNSLEWEKQAQDRFYYTLRASHPDRPFDTRYRIEVIGNSAEFIDHQPFGSDKKTRKTFDTNQEALPWAKKKKRETTRELENDGWRN